MPSAAIAILEFGRVIHTEDKCSPTSRDPERRTQAQERLVSELVGTKSASLKAILNYGPTKPIDRVALRLVSLVAYQQLCTNKMVLGISDVVLAVAGDAPAAVLEARQVLSQL